MHTIRYIIFIISLAFIFNSCANFLAAKEARDDQRAYAKAEMAQKTIPNTVKPQIETPPVPSEIPLDDAADDPALWLNTTHPEQSIIYGANKKGGIHLYDLNGQEKQFVPCGFINNVDVRQGIQWGDSTADFVAGSNRTDNSVVFFVIHEDGSINTTPDHVIDLTILDPYGFCLHKTPDNKLNAFVNNKKGIVIQFEIFLNESGQIVTRTLRQFKLKSQVEGMVVDDANQQLYIGEEEVGIHVLSAKPNADTRTTMLNGSTRENKNIRYDIEGITIFRHEGKSYLLASIQGNFSYAIFDLQKEEYVTSFTIANGNQVDGVEETDGLDILQAPLGQNFPQGVLVTQDGFNRNSDILVNQNFKYIDLQQILALL